LKKALIVTPNWPPVSCPDLHRVRMALPYFADFGWDPLILRINPAEQEGIKDPDLCRTVPDHIKTWQAGCLPLRLTKWAGLRSVGLRSYFHLAKLGGRIIKKESPAMVFFSTTMFPVMTLGRYWRRRHGLPYVLDFQDPWRRSDLRPPTSDLRSQTLKRRLSGWVAGVLEPFTLRGVSHVVSVSPAYVDALRARYSWVGEKDFTTLPFGAAESDFAALPRLGIKQTLFDPKDGRVHWIYVGRGGGDMAFSLRAFFTALRQLLESRSERRSKLRVHFAGTDYAPKDRARKTVEPLAQECGLGDIVSELTDRLPYFEVLQCLRDAEALIIPGSDDPGYTASKIYPYILARKPLLAIFHAQSSVVEILKRTKAGTVVSFQTGDSIEQTANRITETGWLDRPIAPRTDWSAFEPYTAREMTRRLCQVFDQTIEKQKTESRKWGS
jgi:glycosyltransferase involved in cell wall biosynthesis